jgi:hypothetical protein
MNRSTCKLFIFVATMPALAGLSSAGAQNLINVNAADRGDGRVNLVNPAMVAWQDPLFTIGSKILYMGITDGTFDLRNSYFSLTTSYRKLGKFEEVGYGLQGQVLQTLLFNAVTLNAVVAKKVHPKVTVGTSLGFMNRSFDRNRLEVEDENDPLLKSLSKWVFPDIGLGVLAVPHRNIALAFSASHLTQPDVGVDAAPARLPPSFNLGAAVGMGHFRALIGVSRDEHETVPAFAFESFRPELGFLRIGYGGEAATVESQVKVMPGVNLSYRYTYPVNELRLASSGSHELSLVFNFRKHASLYEVEWLEPEIARRPVINPATAFVVESAFDTLFILDKYIKRRIDTTSVKAQELAKLPEEIFFSGDSLEPDLPKFGAFKLMSALEAAEAGSKKYDLPVDTASVIHEMEKVHKKEYLTFLREKFAARLQDPNFQARIVIPPDAKRAYTLLKYLSLFGPITDRLEVAMEDSARLLERGKLGGRSIPDSIFHRTLHVEADTFDFELNLKDLRWGPVAWMFILEDARGNVVKDTTGGIPILRRLIWNWRVKNGEVIAPGTYYYYLRWESQDGQVYSSPKKPLTVNLDTRRITIEVSRRRGDFQVTPNTKATYILNY